MFQRNIIAGNEWLPFESFNLIFLSGSRTGAGLLTIICTFVFCTSIKMAKQQTFGATVKKSVYVAQVWIYICHIYAELIIVAKWYCIVLFVVIFSNIYQWKLFDNNDRIQHLFLCQTKSLSFVSPWKCLCMLSLTKLLLPRPAKSPVVAYSNHQSCGLTSAVNVRSLPHLTCMCVLFCWESVHFDEIRDPHCILIMHYELAPHNIRWIWVSQFGLKGPEGVVRRETDRPLFLRSWGNHQTSDESNFHLNA